MSCRLEDTQNPQGINIVRLMKKRIALYLMMIRAMFG